MGPFACHDKPFTGMLSAQNDYPEVAKVHSMLEGHQICHGVVIMVGF